MTLYRACLKAGRTLVVDLYTAEVMEALAEFGKLPGPGWSNLKVVITSAFVRMYRRTGREAFLERMVPHGISADQTRANSGKVGNHGAPFAHPGLCGEGVAPNADDAWCWSMWRGYLDNDDGSWSASGSKKEEAALPTFIRAAMRLRLICDRSPTR